jgi:hypothetical protein
MLLLLGKTTQKIGVVVAAAFVGGAALGGGGGDARSAGPVVGTAKGAVGGALLGGEVVTITMGAIGVSRGWPYFVFGGVGAVGGAIGGYFVEGAAPAEVPLYMLAGGMALVIPALVVSLNATAYKPPEGSFDEPVNNEPAAEPQNPDGTTTRKIISSARPKARRVDRDVAALHIPTSFFDVYEGRLALGAPAVDVRPLYTERERWMFGVAQGHEVRIPVFQAAF